MKRPLYISLLLFSIAFLSCTGELEETPLTTPSSETFLSDANEIQKALVGAQSPLTLQMDQVPFNIYFDCGSDIGAERDVTPDKLYSDPSSGSLSDIWLSMYRGISRCNFILDNINRAKDEVSEDLINRYSAEAKTLRAYYYHVLFSLFGGVPIIDHVQSLDEAYVSRETADKTVDFIIRTCKEAVPYLQEENEPNTMAITKGLAWSIIARTALFSGRWQEAIDACQNIMKMEGSQYILDPSYADLTTVKGKTSKEIIWAIQYDQDDIPQYMPKKFESRLAGGYCNKMPVQALVDSYECTDGLPIDKSPLYDPQHPWNNRDPRLGYTVALPGSIYMGYQFETNKDSLWCWDYHYTPAIRRSNLDATHTYAVFSGYCWRKYVDESEWRTDGASSINAIVFRYAEILLIYAEAKIELNSIDQSVYDAINKVRNRVGMPNIAPNETQQQLRASVRKERKYELAGEGLRLFDIRRWKIADRLMNGPCYGRIPCGYPHSAPVIDEYGNPDYTNFAEKNQFGIKLGTRSFDPSKNYLSPIPTAEIMINPNLKQSPNY
jgi:hypothetical protein